jgi:hypothetical protein
MATNNTIDFQWSTTPTKDTPLLREQPQPLNGTPKELEEIFVLPQEDAADFGEELTSFFKGQEPAKSTQATTTSTIPLPRTPAPIQPLTLRINDKKRCMPCGFLFLKRVGCLSLKTNSQERHFDLATP